VAAPETHEVLHAAAPLERVAASNAQQKLPEVSGLRRAALATTGGTCTLPRCGCTLSVNPARGASTCMLCMQPYARHQDPCVYCGLRLAPPSVMRSLEVPMLL
jgi:hypothetical protein